MQKAESMFPDLVPEFDEVDNPYLLWIELRSVFEKAYERDPRDESMIERIYRYSDWCMSQPRGQTSGDDLFTCVAVCFYEHIPEHPGAREDMPRWWLAEDLVESGVFHYHLTDDEFRDLKGYLVKESHRYDARLRTGA